MERPGDTAPAARWGQLGDTEQHAREVLGPPADTSKLGSADVFDYASGLQIIGNPTDGVSIIRLRSRGAGSIDGVRIGDDPQSVLAKWGKPDSGAGAVALYNAGVWTVEVKLDATGLKVGDILLAWNTTKWPDENPQSGKFYRPN